MIITHKIKSILKDTSGSAIPMMVAVILIILLLSSAIFEYLRLITILKNIRDSAENAIISVATENWAGVYGGIREGYSGAYDRADEIAHWQAIITEGDVFQRLAYTLEVNEDGGEYVRMAEGKTLFSIANLQLKIDNSSFAPTSSGQQQFTVYGDIDVTIPLNFGFDKIPPLKTNLEFKASYLPKF